MHLSWHRYKYYPYEFDLAQREINSLLVPESVVKKDDGVFVNSPSNPELAQRLVYFSGFTDGETPPCQTQQSALERVNGNGTNRQSTRYSAHGLHEYKGEVQSSSSKGFIEYI